MMNDNLREQLASLSHHQWAEWMRYLFSKCDEVYTDGSIYIPREYVENLRRQISLPYSQLSEAEKDSDRKEADRILHLVQCEVAGNLLSGKWRDERTEELKNELAQLRHLLKVMASFDWDTLLAAAGGVPYSFKYECDWDEFIERVYAVALEDEPVLQAAETERQ
jgi:hypothetical protein